MIFHQFSIFFSLIALISSYVRYSEQIIKAMVSIKVIGDLNIVFNKKLIITKPINTAMPLVTSQAYTIPIPGSRNDNIKARGILFSL